MLFGKLFPEHTGLMREASRDVFITAFIIFLARLCCLNITIAMIAKEKKILKTLLHCILDLASPKG